MNEPTLDGMTEPGEGADSLGGYAESTAELEQILSSLQNDDIDIDTLTSKVKRATLLISHCEERLRATELSLQTVLAQHDNGSPGEAA